MLDVTAENRTRPADPALPNAGTIQESVRFSWSGRAADLGSDPPVTGGSPRSQFYRDFVSVVVENEWNKMGGRDQPRGSFTLTVTGTFPTALDSSAGDPFDGPHRSQFETALLRCVREVLASPRADCEQTVSTPHGECHFSVRLELRRSVPTQATVKRLIDSLDDADEVARLEPIRELVSYGSADESVVQLLLESLGKELPKRRRRGAATALGHFVADAAAVAPALITAAHDRDEWVAKYALESLGRLAIRSEEAVAALLAGMYHPKSAIIQHGAAVGLGLLGLRTDDVVAGLLSALEPSREVRVRTAGLRAIGGLCLAGETVISHVVAILTERGQEDVRREAVHTLSELEAGTDEVGVALLGCLDDGGVEVAVEAAAALVRLFPPERSTGYLLASRTLRTRAGEMVAVLRAAGGEKPLDERLEFGQRMRNAYRQLDKQLSQYLAVIKGLSHESQTLDEAKVALDQLVAKLAEQEDLERAQRVATIQPALNRYLNLWAAEQQRIAETSSERRPELIAAAKKSVGQLVNQILKRFDLSISRDDTPCRFYVFVTARNRNGQFQLLPFGSNSALVSRSKLADLLPFSLTDAPTRREALDEWRERETARNAAHRPPSTRK